MRAVVVVLAFILYAGVAPAQDPVRILIQFQESPHPEIVESFRTELSSLFEAAGRPLDIRLISERPLRKRNERAAVIYFFGFCKAPRVITSQENSIRSLAHVHEVGERIMDLIEVDCPQVSHYISSAINTYDLGRLKFLYGRALARVTAHELLHWMLNEKKHSTSRLFRAHVEAEHLIADGIALEEREVSRLHQLGTRVTLADGM